MDTSSGKEKHLISYIGVDDLFVFISFFFFSSLTGLHVQNRVRQWICSRKVITKCWIGIIDLIAISYLLLLPQLP